MTEINKLHNTIKFTHEINNTELTFLDVTLYKGTRFHSRNILDIRTHIKPTNKQLYVHESSYHPPFLLAAISKGETHRYLHTNSDENNFHEMTLNNLVHRLKHRGYNKAKSLNT